MDILLIGLTLIFFKNYPLKYVFILLLLTFDIYYQILVLSDLAFSLQTSPKLFLKTAIRVNHCWIYHFHTNFRINQITMSRSYSQFLTLSG